MTNTMQVATMRKRTLHGWMSCAGMSRTDALAILALLGFLCLIAYPTWRRMQMSASRPRLDCQNNLKQIGLSLRTWSIDHNGELPWQVPATNGGSLEFVPFGNPAPHFQVMSNELHTTKLLICPGDLRQQALNFGSLSSQNVSYFLSMDATVSLPNSITSGDRNLTVGTKPCSPGSHTLSTNLLLTWGRDIHRREGNLLFADGHVETASNNLGLIIQRQMMPSNRVSVP